MIRLLCFVALLCTVALPHRSQAHELDPGFLELQALGGESWRVLWRVPQVAGQPMGLGLDLPAACAPQEGPALVFDGRGFVTQWVVNCAGGIAGGQIAVPGLERTRTDVLVRYELEPGLAETRRLTPATPAFEITAPLGQAGVITTYGALGVSHILSGWDHLLFVFCLLLLIRDARRLLGAVTAFTVAHSLTLAAATLGWIVVPAAPVEAVVALSIMFLAAELVRPAGRGLRLTDRFPWTVAFAFGLLHGLGFARALVDIGLPEGDVPLALFAFNVGVEVGQLLFILVVLVTLHMLRWFFPRLIASVTMRGQPGARLIGYLAGGLSAAWFVSRIAAL